VAAIVKFSDAISVLSRRRCTTWWCANAPPKEIQDPIGLALLVDAQRQRSRYGTLRGLHLLLGGLPRTIISAPATSASDADPLNVIVEAVKGAPLNAPAELAPTRSIEESCSPAAWRSGAPGGKSGGDLIQATKPASSPTWRPRNPLPLWSNAAVRC